MRTTLLKLFVIPKRLFNGATSNRFSLIVCEIRNRNTSIYPYHYHLLGLITRHVARGGVGEFVRGTHVDVYT